MLDVPAKPDMGLIIRRRADQLTLSRESRNKPEEKGALETHTQLSLLKAAAKRTDESVDPVCWVTIPLWTNCLKGFLVVYVLFIWFILNLGCGEPLSSFGDALVLIQHFIPCCYTMLHPSSPCASMSVLLSSVRMLLWTELKSSIFLLSRYKLSASFFLSLFKSRRQAKHGWMSFKIGNIMKQNRYSTVDVDWNMLCLFSHALFVMPGCWGEDWPLRSLLVSYNFPFVFPQPNQRRREIKLQHSTANQIKDELYRSRQVLLALWAGMSIQMSPHRHHLARLFTGQWKECRTHIPQSIQIWSLSCDLKYYSCSKMAVPLAIRAQVFSFVRAFVEADSVRPPDGQRPGQHGPG